MMCVPVFNSMFELNEDDNGKKNENNKKNKKEAGKEVGNVKGKEEW